MAALLSFISFRLQSRARSWSSDHVRHDCPISRQACMATEGLRQHDALFSMLGATLGRRGSRHDPQNDGGRPTAQVSGYISAYIMTFVLGASVNPLRLNKLAETSKSRSEALQMTVMPICKTAPTSLCRFSGHGPHVRHHLRLPLRTSASLLPQGLFQRCLGHSAGGCSLEPQHRPWRLQWTGPHAGEATDRG